MVVFTKFGNKLYYLDDCGSIKEYKAGKNEKEVKIEQLLVRRFLKRIVSTIINIKDRHEQEVLALRKKTNKLSAMIEQQSIKLISLLMRKEKDL